MGIMGNRPKNLEDTEVFILVDGERVHYSWIQEEE